MSTLSTLWNDVLSLIRGKVVPTIDADAQKALADVKKVVDGVYGVATDAPNVTGILGDLGALVVSGTALVASRGADFPEFVALLSEVKDLTARIDKVVTDYQVGAALVSSAPPKTS